MRTLQIQLLGDFRLTYGDEAITSVNTPRLQSLLAYLVLHRDAPQSRQHLAFLLWPNSTEAQAHTNLRNLYHHLRQALPGSDQFLQAEATTLRWRPDSPYTLDAIEFERALAQAAAVQEWQRVVELYIGDLLPGCYDDWILPERERLRQEFVEASRRLIVLLEEQHDYRAAVGCAQRLLRYDPLREETYRDLMRLSAFNGDRAGVARFFSICKTVLARELDVEPSAETRAAHVQYLDQAAANPPRPAMTSEAQSHNLPLQLSRFVGRVDELKDIKHLVMQNRLLTLVGAAGVGKTRLGLAAAEQVLDFFPDGVWLIDLAPLADPAHLAYALALPLGVRETPGRGLIETLADYLRDRKVLIVLDNCEHLIQAAGSLIEALLGAAPEVRFLATSREVLGIAGEQVWRVHPLPVPDPIQSVDGGPERGEGGVEQVQQMLQCPSVELLVDRASAILPSFEMTNDNAPAVAQICRRLDGIPLAIELAAGRVNVMTVEQIEKRLDDALGLLSWGSPRALMHHRTLRAAMDWSHDTLSEKEQRLLRRLAVFAGGFTIEAAEQVTSDSHLPLPEILDLLSSLTDKSLVTMQAQEGGTRGRLLEPVRQYADEKLHAAGEAHELHSRHLDFFLHLAQDLDAQAWGADQAIALQRLEQEHDNIRAALTWSIEGDPERGLRLASSLIFLFELHGYTTQERGWIEKLLTLNEKAPPGVRAKALYAAAGNAYLRGEMKASRSLYQASLELYRELDDELVIADILAWLGMIASTFREFALARSLLEESLAVSKARGEAEGPLSVRLHLGFALCHLDERARGLALLEQGLSQSREWGAHGFTGVAQMLLSFVAYEDGDYAQARWRYREAVGVSQQAGVGTGVMYGLGGLGVVAASEGQFERAARLLGVAARISQDTGMGLVPLEQSHHDHAIDLTRAALGEQDFAALWAEGSEMSLEQAIAYAMEDDR